MLKLTLFALPVTMFFLIACAPTPATVPITTPLERATQAPLQRPTAAETADGRELPLAPDVLAIYHKSGGFVGLDETLTVYQGGLIELTGRGIENAKSVKLDEPMLQPVRRMLEAQEFANLEPMYRVKGADQFTYAISARDRNGNMKTVVAVDGANYPDFLGQLIAMFEQLRTLIK